MRSFLTTTKLLVDDDVFLSSLASLSRSFCALLLSMLTLMPSSAATARTTTGCSFGVVCVRVCFYSFEVPFTQLFWEMSLPPSIEDELGFFEF
jgi:hypothetical protein